MHRVLLATLTAGALLAPAPAPAQLFSDNEARKAILDLRSKQADLEAKDVTLGERLERLEAANRAQLELSIQVDTLKQELARLRGQIELLSNEVATLQKRNRDLYTDLEARLKKMEPQSVTVDGRTGNVAPAEQAAYDNALARFRANDFNGAAPAFQSFLSQYPNSVYTPSARYWLGSAYYAARDHKAAIATYLALVDGYPDSPRAPDALLAVAASQMELKDKRVANATLSRIIRNYPDSEAAKAARERLPATK